MSHLTKVSAVLTAVMARLAPVFAQTSKAAELLRGFTPPAGRPTLTDRMNASLLEIYRE